MKLHNELHTSHIEEGRKSSETLSVYSEAIDALKPAGITKIQGAVVDRLEKMLGKELAADIFATRGTREALDSDGWTEPVVKQFMTGLGEQGHVSLQQLFTQNPDDTIGVPGAPAQPAANLVTNPTVPSGKSAIRAINHFAKTIPNAADVLTKTANAKDAKHSQAVVSLQAALQGFDPDDFDALDTPGVLVRQPKKWELDPKPTGDFAAIDHQILSLENSLLPGWLAKIKKPDTEYITGVRATIDQLKDQKKALLDEQKTIRDSQKQVVQSLKNLGYTYDPTKKMSVNLTDALASKVEINGVKHTIEDWHTDASLLSTTRRLSERGNFTFGGKLPAEQLLREMVTLNIYGEYREFTDHEKATIDKVVAQCLDELPDATEASDVQYKERREAVLHGKKSSTSATTAGPLYDLSFKHMWSTFSKAGAWGKVGYGFASPVAIGAKAITRTSRGAWWLGKHGIKFIDNLRKF